MVLGLVKGLSFRARAQAHGRPVPPLVAHVLAAVSEDRPAVLSATRVQIQGYGKLPFYASMFADAGYPVGANGNPSNDLIASLVISGGARAITERFKELLASGLDELMVQLISVKQTESELHQLMQLIGHNVISYMFVNFDIKSVYTPVYCTVIWY